MKYLYLVLLAMSPTAIGASPQVVESQSLSFGTLIAGANAGAATVYANGGRGCSGGTVCLDKAVGNPASFSVSGDPYTTYIITLPDQITLTDSANRTITVDSFSDDLNGSITLGGSGTASVNVGATLHIEAGQTTGNYSGNFSILVEHQ